MPTKLSSKPVKTKNLKGVVMQPDSLTQVIEVVTQGFQLDINGHHGLPHWQRVAQRGRELALATGANPKVVSLFAYLHDACREDEYEDPEHGFRGAENARSLWRTGRLALDMKEMDLLYAAIKEHSDGRLSADPTIATCWDADRLDLWRVGVTPAARFLCTEAAKQMLTREINLNNG
jgi:uncharacterized protein